MKKTIFSPTYSKNSLVNVYMSLPKVNLKVESNNPIVDFYKLGDANSMFRLVNQTDEFKLQKNTGAGLEDVMTINEDGVIVFPKNVEFRGSSTVINTDIVTFQDQQVDLGLTNTVNLDVSSVTKTTAGANYRYAFKLQDSNKTVPFAVNDYVLIQNLISTATPAVSLLDSVALPVVVVSNGTSPKTFTIETSANLIVANIANTTNVIASKITSVATNSGVRFLGLNGSSLVEGALQFNSSNNLSLENNTGTISVGSNSVNQNINVGTAGARTIQVGSVNATAVNVDAVTFSIDSSNASNINTSSGILTVAGSGGLALNSNAGVINLGNEAVTGAINVGTAGARTIQVGSASATAVNVDAVTFSVDSSSASNINTSSGVLTVGGAGGLALNSNGGVINLGNEAVSGNINIGTAGSRTIQVGSASATAVNLDASTFSIESSSASNVSTSSGVLTVGGAGGVDVNSTGGVINIGNAAVSGAINVGTGGSRTVQVGSASATAVNVDAVTFSIDASSGSNINTSSGVLTLGGSGGVAVNSNNGVINIGNESHNNNINIGSAGARTVQVGSSSAVAVNIDAGSSGISLDATGNSNFNTSSGLLSVGGHSGLNLNSATGVINVGNEAVNGGINVGTAGTRTIQVGSNNATVNVNSGSGGINLSTTTGGVTVTSTGGTLTLNGTGRTVDLDAALLDINSTSISMNSTGMIAINSSANVINIGNNAVDLNINIGTAGNRVVQVGSSTATVNLDAGSGGISLDAVGPSNFTSSAGLLTLGGGSGVTVNSTGGTLTLDASGRTLDAQATTFNVNATTGGINLESNTGVINIGNNAFAQNINIGRQGARTISVGSASAAAVNVDAVTFSIDASSGSNVSTSSGLLTVSGGSGVTVTSTGGTLTLDGSNQTVDLNAATLDIDATTATLDTTGVIAINSSGGVINIGNNSVAQDINIGTAGARTITLGSTSSTAVNAYNFNVASDLMLKTNVTPLASTLDKVLQLDGYRYNWKDSENHATQIGLIAQEVEQQFPELVIQNNNFKSVNYLGMIAVLIHAMKEQQQEIENIRNKIN
jgi:urease beta subunit